MPAFRRPSSTRRWSGITSRDGRVVAQFRVDVESFVSREAVQVCVALDVHERAPLSSVRYYGFVDPSGGSADSMTLAVGHREGDVLVLDAMRERKPAFARKTW